MRAPGDGWRYQAVTTKTRPRVSGNRNFSPSAECRRPAKLRTRLKTHGDFLKSRTRDSCFRQQVCERSERFFLRESEGSQALVRGSSDVTASTQPDQRHYR
jgi:hypothetical protein